VLLILISSQEGKRCSPHFKRPDWIVKHWWSFWGHFSLGSCLHSSNWGA